MVILVPPPASMGVSKSGTCRMRDSDVRGYVTQLLESNWLEERVPPRLLPAQQSLPTTWVELLGD